MFSPDANAPYKPAEPTRAFGSPAPQIPNHPHAAEPLLSPEAFALKEEGRVPGDIGTLDTAQFPVYQQEYVPEAYKPPTPLAKVSKKDLDQIIAKSVQREEELKATKGVAEYWENQTFLWELGAEEAVEHARAIDATFTSLIDSLPNQKGKVELWKNTLAEAASKEAIRVCSRRESYVYASNGTPFKIDSETNELRPSTDRSKKPVVGWFTDPKMKEEIGKTAGERYTEKEVSLFFLENLRRQRLVNGGTLSDIEEQSLQYEARELATEFRARGFAARLESGGYLGTPVMAEKIGTLPFEGPTRAFAVNRLLTTFRMLGAFPNLCMGFGALTQGEQGDTVFSIRPSKEKWKPITNDLVLKLGMSGPSEWKNIFLEEGLATEENVDTCIETFRKGLAEAATFSALIGTMDQGSFRVEPGTGKVFLDNTPDALSLTTDLPCLEKTSGARTALYTNDLDTLGRTTSAAFELANHAELQLDPTSALALKNACRNMQEPGSTHRAIVEDLFALIHGDETIAALEVQRLLRLATFAADMNDSLRLRETHLSFTNHQPNTPILLQLLKKQGYKKEDSKEAGK